MSALQTFMLVVDHNKEEATDIAKQAAQGTVLFSPISLSEMLVA